MTTEELVKCAQLDMLAELDRICKINDIPYFAVGGTLIGAIRHDGFIPWDDDIDVGMLRDNYEKFKKVCQNELSKEYSLFDWNRDTLSPLPFLKMKIKGSHYREELSKKTEMNDEIFIDIFPFDNAPDNKILQMRQGIINTFLKKILLLKYGFSIDGDSIIKKVVYLPFKLVSKLNKEKKWKELFDKNAQRYNNINTTKVVNLCGAYSYKKELKDRYYLESLILHKFEGLMISIPENYDSYLREVYGDYMVLPPESQRVSRHGVSFIDLGEYKVKNSLKSEG